MQNGEKGFEPVWCPFYREDSGRSIYCEGITEMRALYGHQREVCG